MSPQPLRYLFVYGTLMAGECRHPLLAAGMIRSIAVAAVRGTLFNLGDYPGMVLGGETTVAGELVEFLNLDGILGLLDAEEGPEYLREVVEVNLPHGRNQRAWSYVLAAPPANALLIESGDWRSRSASEPPTATLAAP